MPPTVVKLADAYILSLPSKQGSSDRDQIRNSFVRFFFLGFINPTGSMGDGDRAVFQGFKAGQEYRRDHPDQLKEIFESFGYVATEAEGIWTTHFEHSGFRPRGRTQETWWLSGVEGMVSDLRRDEEIPTQGLRVRIHGFISPKGRHGHLGQYDYEFYATRIVKERGK